MISLRMISLNEFQYGGFIPKCTIPALKAIANGSFLLHLSNLCFLGEMHFLFKVTILFVNRCLD